MRLKRKIFLFLVFMLSLSIIRIVIFLPKVHAISLSQIINEITPPSTPYAITVDSNGYVYYGDENGHIWKSINEGITWTEIYTGFTGKATEMLEFDSNDNLFLYVSINLTVMKSTDYGETFTATTNGDLGGSVWHFEETNKGTLYLQIYSTPKPYVYKSTDNGDSWNLYFNLTEHYHLVDHLHCFASNPYTDECYISSGDGIQGNLTLWRHTDATGWTMLWNMTQNYQYNYNPTEIWFDERYVYFGSDGNYDFISRMPHKGNLTEDWCGLLRRDEWSGPLDFATASTYSDGIHILTTNQGRIFASFDGEHWVYLWSGGSVDSLAQTKSKGNYYWACDNVNGKIIRMAIDQKVLAHLFYNSYLSLSDDTLTFEKIIRNGTTYIDFSEYGVSDAKIKFQGVQLSNLVTNGSFEQGVLIVSGAQNQSDDGGWWSRYGDLYQVSGGHEGTYCIMAKTSAYGVGLHPLEFHDYPYAFGYQSKEGDVYTVDFWVKGNFSTASGDYAGLICFRWRNSTHSGVDSWKFLTTTEWNHIWYAQIIPTWATEVCFYLSVSDKPFKCYFDEVTLACYDDTIYDSGGLDCQALHSARTPNSWVNDNINTTDLSVTIGTQTFEHSGTLANGAWTSESDLDTNGGILRVSANIDGSCMTKIHVEATKAYQVSNALLKNEVSSGVFNATYYDIPEIESTNEIIILVQKNVSLTSVSVDSNHLTFVIDAQTEYESTTYLYYGGRGKPQQIHGASNWEIWGDYAKISVYHASEKTIVVSWDSAVGGDVLFRLTVYAIHNGFPTQATVNINGENRSIFGVTFYNLKFGTYTVTVYCHGEKHTKTVGLYGDCSLGFEFKSPPKERLFINRGFLIAVPIAIIVGVAIFTLFFKRGHR